MAEFNFELLNGLSACPYCGGTEGYYFTSVQRFYMQNTWRSENRLGEYENEERTTKPRCVDCNRYIKEQDL